MNGLQHFPLGQRLPGSIHSVGVSLPTVADVCGYEEKRPETVAALATGYPRFLEHPYIGRLRAHLGRKWALSDRLLVFASTAAAAADMVSYTGCKDAAVRDEGSFTAVSLPRGAVAEERARAYLQHTGAGLSSRLAEDLLYAEGLLDERQEEAVTSDGAEAFCMDALRDLYGLSSRDSVSLCNSGMNAIYSTYRGISEWQRERGRTVWIQLGWLYVDTIFILEKFAGEKAPQIFLDVFDLDAVERYLSENGTTVAGIITEVPSNPLMQTCDLPRLHALARDHEVPLVVDPTMASPYNVNILPHADFIVNSLTKYAACEGDVLSGAAIANSQFQYCEELLPIMERFQVRPYRRELSRLAWEMRDYREVAETMNENAEALANFLEGRPRVKKVYWAYESCSKANYDAIARRPISPGCVVTVVLNGPLAEVYDHARMAKSPSFGTRFTILSPYIYLAHYDYVVDPAKRAFLTSHDIDPELLRVSVGTEPTEAILAAFAEVF